MKVLMGRKSPDTIRIVFAQLKKPIHFLLQLFV